jgi:hypothetical protein
LGDVQKSAAAKVLRKVDFFLSREMNQFKIFYPSSLSTSSSSSSSSSPSSPLFTFQ